MDDYYNQIARGYNELHGEEQLKKLNEVYEYLKENNLLENVKRILDVGCGTGISSDFFAKKNFQVTGIDPAQELINNNENEKELSNLIVAPAENLPFKENEFDLVISFTAIQNFDDLNKGLQEIKRVGKGKFVLTVLNNVKRIEEIDKAIRNLFDVQHYSEGKDRIYFIH